MLFDLISRSRLHRLAGDEVFVRGQDYFTDKRVANLRATRNKVTASVVGTQAYDVALCDVSGRLQHSCTCPHSADGNFCKHAVALGLAWLADPVAREMGGAGAVSHWRTLRKQLDEQPPAALVGLLIEIAQNDPESLDTLLEKTTPPSPDSDIAIELELLLKDAGQPASMLSCDRSGFIAKRIRPFIDHLANRLSPVTAGKALPVAQDAIALMLAHAGGAEDWTGSLATPLTRIGRLHLRACLLANPDPDEMISWLLQQELAAPQGGHRYDYATYKDALGPDGWQRYWKQVDAGYQEARTSPTANPARVLKLARIREALAKAGPSLDGWIAVKAESLSDPGVHWEVVEALDAADRHAEAVAWAERAVTGFPGRVRHPVYCYLLAEYLAVGQLGPALLMTRAQFDADPGLETYLALRRIAETCGTWADERKRALDFVAGRWPPHGGDLRAQLAREEGDWATVWGLAQAIPLRIELWTWLASADISRSPVVLDAVTAEIRRLSAAEMALVKYSNYDKAVALVGRIVVLLRDAALSDLLEGYLTWLATEYQKLYRFQKDVHALLYTTPSTQGAPGSRGLLGRWPYKA